MIQTPIIMLCGEAGSGKDTAATIIQELIPKTILIAQSEPLKDLGAKLFKFSKDQLYGPSESRNAPDPRFDSKEIWTEMRWNNSVIRAWLEANFPNNKKAETLFNYWFDNLYLNTCGIKKQLTPRIMLQTLGTEFGRAIEPNVWTDIAMRKAKEYLINGTANLVLITDGRFKNEILNAKANNALALLIKLPDSSNVTVGILGHKSEAELKQIPDYWYTDVIINLKQLGLDFYKDQINDFLDKHVRIKHEPNKVS